MPQFISVVICTHNRADLLAGALQTVCDQTADPASYEVIVVDNDSSDTTASVAADFSRRFPNVRYCLEKRLGLSHARNRGYVEAQGAVVAYIDDDTKVPPEWLAVAQEIAEAKAPAVFGGPNYPWFETEKPYWFKDHYGAHDLGPEARALDAGEYVYGMNMFFRRGILEAAGGFDPGLGMSGKRIAYGEEIAVMLRVRQEMPGEVIYYDPRLYVYHLVPARKIRWPGIVRHCWSLGRYSFILTNEKPGWSKRVSAALRAVYEVGGVAGVLIKAPFRRDRAGYPYVQNYIYEKLRPHIGRLGALFERMRLSHP